MLPTNGSIFLGLNLPAKPMIKILQNFATANNAPFTSLDWCMIKDTFEKYNEVAKRLN